jgi:L-rhamnose-H+ transport protein
MSEHFWLGMTIALIGGVLNGSFAVPMKYIRRWHWENTWLVFSFMCLELLPWALALTFVPRLGEVFRGVPARALLYTIGFGLIWGVSLVMYGVAIKMVGMALTIAVVAGLSCLVGSLTPLVVLHPGELLHPRGLLLLVSMPILFLGLHLYRKAGLKRETEQATPGSTTAATGRNLAVGLAVCIFTGLIGSTINLGFAFSGDLIRRGLELGANHVTSTYPVWALVLGAGFVPNAIYCSFLLSRNKTWALFGESGWPAEVLLSIAPALLWLTGVLGYGVGANLIGVYGTSLGFALMQSAQILSANVSGVLAGEWAGTSLLTKKLLAGAVASILVSVVVLNLGGVF